MTRILVTLAGVLLAAQVIVRPPSQQQSPATQNQFAERQQLLSGEPYQVLFAEKAWAGAAELVPLLSSSDPLVRIAAVTAVGRLEDPATVPALMATRELNTGFAIAQALHGVDPAADPQTIDRVGALPGVAGGKVRYGTAEQVQAVELSNDAVAELTANDPTRTREYEGAIAALESLARVNQRLKAFDDRTVKVLENSVARQSANDDFPVIRRHAFTALMNAGAVTPDAEKIALNEQDWPIRRLAILVLAGGGAGLDVGTRVAAIQSALADPSPIVRYESLRAYVRRGVPVAGCQPILSMLTDDDTHVTLAALDALGDQCKDDQDITMRVQAETTTPQTQNWHRPTHAFVALAKRDHERAVSSMEAFATHPNWWVRMYAARAAAILEDTTELDKLSADVNDNVREATLVPLRKLKHFDADPAIAATLNSGDVQLLRTAARLLKESPHTHYLFRPLMTALTRLTTEGKETSRDARLALLDAIEVHIGQTESPELKPLLKDFDPKVAARAADLMTKLTNKETLAEPVLPHRGWPSEFNHNRDTCVTVAMAYGGKFVLDLDWAAPITVDHFLKLATKDHYYDGLTFHRVEPNFVIQGGSPGANEYSGAKDYMRDEISPTRSHVRGTVGLSTRGRNTADAQFFVNLVDNPRLDLGYTIFASVRDADMPVIDRIEEGAEIRSIALGCAPKPRSR